MPLEDPTPMPFVLPEDLTGTETIYEDEEIRIVGGYYSRGKGRKKESGRAVFWMSCVENSLTKEKSWKEESSMGVATWIASHIGTTSQIDATSEEKVEPWRRLVAMTTAICDFLNG